MNRRFPIHALRPRGGNRRVGVYGSLLFFQLLDRISKLEHKPPITVTLIALNLIIFALPLIHELIPPPLLPLIKTVERWTAPRRACLHPSAVLSGERYRLLLSSFVHASDIHLLYNLLSFLYKGVTLETALGSHIFLALVLFLSFVAHAIYLAVAVAAAALGLSAALMSNCLVGFSGVIFGLKVVVNSDPRFSQRASRIFGFSLPSGGSPWAELFIAQLASPNVSFLGHLSGIFAGLIYVHVPRFIARQLRQPRNA